MIDFTILHWRNHFTQQNTIHSGGAGGGLIPNGYITQYW